MRLSYLGLCVALCKPFCGGSSCDTGSAFPAGFPFVTFSYRAL